MEAVGDEEWDDEDIGEGGEAVPVGDEGRLFHVSWEDFAEDAELGEEADLLFGGFGGVVVEGGAVGDDDEGGLSWG